MMSLTGEHGAAVLHDVSNALVRLHKEQFGRGPVVGRSYFTGDDGLMCILDDALLPAERTLVQLGDGARVREMRGALQSASADRFIAVVEELTGRRVRAFSSGVDPEQGTVFETFAFAARSSTP